MQAHIRSAILVLLLFASALSRADSYFVNDTSTNGDVYCTTTGSDAYSGLSNTAPKLSIQAIFDTYTLASGDTLYIDTGLYTNYTVTLTARVSSCTIQGSTNFAGGGTIIDRMNAAQYVLRFHADGNGPANVTVRDLTLRGGSYGLAMTHNGGINYKMTNNFFYRLRIVDNANGVYTDGYVGGGNCFTECAFAHSGFALNWSTHAADWLAVSNTVIYSDNGNGMAGNVRARHCIIYVAGAGKSALASGSPAGDYNLFFVTNGAVINPSYNTLSSWVAATTNEQHSLAARDPLFSDLLHYDFHLQSAAGRYSNGVWVADAVFSPALDIGDPAANYANELAPNGGRLNVGRYGNTTDASKSNTNKWLQVLTCNDGGYLAGTVTLYWVQGNLTNAGDTVRLEHSVDGGANWSLISNAVVATNGQCLWNTTAAGATAAAKWKIIYESDTKIFSETDNRFALRNGPVNYYVNVTNTSGDVYCTAPGSPTNSGTLPSEPLDRISAVVDMYQLVGGDIVYIDTGTYNLTNYVYITPDDVGDSWSSMVTFQGSTNYAAGGTVLDRGGGNYIFYLYVSRAAAVQYLALKDMTLCNASSAALYLRHLNGMNQGVKNTLFESLVIRDNAGYGIDGSSQDSVKEGNRCLRCVFADNAQRAIAWDNGHANDRLTLDNCVVYGTPTNYALSGYFAVSNSILHVSGSGKKIYDMTNIISDYNDIFTTNGAQIHASYATLAAWSNSTRDPHSIDRDPLFANPPNDFHLQSKMGRYAGAIWVLDAVHSPAIDAGATNAAYALEPKPNGRRINCGNYGNTREASMSTVAGTVVIIR